MRYHTSRRTKRRRPLGQRSNLFLRQKNWKVNNPRELSSVLRRLERIQKNFNSKQSGDKKISLADLIVLAGSTAVEYAAKNAGHSVKVPFTPGRMDASQEKTDVESFSVLEPKADGFRNYFGENQKNSPAEMLVDRANLLTLTVPEMTVLVGGLRVLNANTNQSKNGVLTNTPEHLNNAFFKNLVDMSTSWTKSNKADGLYEGRDRNSGKLKWTATPVDLIFGSNSELRAVTEVYAADDGEEKFVNDFINAWVKVMRLDRFDLL